MDFKSEDFLYWSLTNEKDGKEREYESKFYIK